MKSIEALKDQCARYHLNILGGDTVRTEGPMVWTVTIIGEVPLVLLLCVVVRKLAILWALQIM